MAAKARRLPVRGLGCLARRALLVTCLLHGGGAACAETISAVYAGPTDRYPHAVLGDAIEHTTLVVSHADGGQRSFVLPDHLVFEDTAPRVVDLDGDGKSEVIVVESSQTEGARLAIYGAEGRIVATPFIGTRFRWLAPVGAADLDGDGAMELGYIDRPHLAKTLRVWRYADQQLTEIATLAGLTNHRIGERDIAGGIRVCDGTTEMVLASANWTELVAVRFGASGLETRRLATETSRAAFARALDCQL